MSAVFNARFYDVYYQRFGLVVRIHLGLATTPFLELSINKKTRKDRLKDDMYK